MPALSETERIAIITARTLARADDRNELIDALALCDSPSLAGVTNPDIGLLHAAALGQLSGLADYLCERLEALAARIDAAEAEALDPTPVPAAAEIWAEAGRHFSAADMAQARTAEAIQSLTAVYGTPPPEGEATS